MEHIILDNKCKHELICRIKILPQLHTKADNNFTERDYFQKFKTIKIQ